jgi:hypothetical protein
MNEPDPDPPTTTDACRCARRKGIYVLPNAITLAALFAASTPS